MYLPNTETARQGMAGLREEDPIRRGGERRNRLEWRLTLPALRQLLAEQAQLDLIGGAANSGCSSKRALEPLDQRALAAAHIDVVARVADRVAKDGQAAVGLPVGHERARDCVTGLREELASGSVHSWRSSQHGKHRADAQGQQRDQADGAYERSRRVVPQLG